MHDKERIIHKMLFFHTVKYLTHLTSTSRTVQQRCTTSEVQHVISVGKSGNNMRKSLLNALHVFTRVSKDRHPSTYWYLVCIPEISKP